MDHDALARAIQEMLKEPTRYMARSKTKPPPMTPSQRAELHVKRAQRQFSDMSRVVNKRKRHNKWVPRVSAANTQPTSRSPQRELLSGSMLRPTELGIVDVSAETRERHIARDLEMHRAECERKRRSERAS